MKTKIKLKDVTKEEFEQWVKQNCNHRSCKECIFKYVMCTNSTAWVCNKDLFSDKFLNQEIEIENVEILDEVEKQYLTNVIKPFKKSVIGIIKLTLHESAEYIYICVKGMQGFSLPCFKKDTMYKGMKNCKEYTLEELAL